MLSDANNEYQQQPLERPLPEQIALDPETQALMEACEQVQ